MIAKRLRNLREENNLKQKDLSKLLNIHQSAYSKYETGRVNVQAENLATIAGFYNVSIEYLMGITDIRDPAPGRK